MTKTRRDEWKQAIVGVLALIGAGAAIRKLFQAMCWAYDKF